MSDDEFLAFVECAGCHELFPVRKKMALNRAKWCSERCRRSQYSTPCVDCGAPTDGSNGHGKNASKRCARCNLTYTSVLAHERSLEHRERVERLWKQGLTLCEMAEAMGWKNVQVAQVQISILRSKGVDLPHRYSPDRAQKTAVAIRAAVVRREQRKKTVAKAA